MDELSDVLLDQGIPGSSGKFILLEALTIPIDLRYMPNEVEKPEHDKRWYNVDFGYVARFQSDEGAAQVPMYPLHKQSCAPDFKQGSLLGIILGRFGDFSDLRWYDVIFIMVVQEKEQYHERVGYTLLPKDWERYRHHHNGDPESVKREMRIIFHSKERRTIRLG